MPSERTLYLSEPDTVAAGVLDSRRCVDVLDEVFGLIGKQDYLMGGRNRNEHGHTLFFPESSPFPNMPLKGPDRRFTSMIAYLGGRFNICGCKWYGSHIVNPARGLPRSVHTITLNDPDTGVPRCIMVGNLVSSIRTGCVPGLAVRYLAKKDAKVCALIGAGLINRACWQGIFSQMPSLRQLVVYDLFTEKAQAFADWALAETGVPGRVAGSLEEAVRSADIINVAASGANPVTMKDEWIPAGATVILTGAARFDDAALLNCTVVYDNPWMQQAYQEERCHFTSSEEFYATMKGGQFFRLFDQGLLPDFEHSRLLCHMANGQQAGRTDQKERFIFLTAGMSVFDVAWGFECFENALRLGLGQELLLWDSPHWI